MYCIDNECLVELCLYEAVYEAFCGQLYASRFFFLKEMREICAGATDYGIISVYQPSKYCY